ncbi:hypothetical protein BDK51DRAFT_18831, partial [Blyttiomyces helicus]
MSSHRLFCWIHDERFSKHDVVVNPDYVPGARLGDLLEIFHPDDPPPAGPGARKPGPRNTVVGGGNKGKRLVLQISVRASPSFIPNASPPSAEQISVAQHIAALFELQARTNVIVRKVEKEYLLSDHVELSFRDQYIGRGDMWRLKTTLVGTCVHRGKKLLSLGIRAQVKNIYVNGKSVSCGYIGETSKTVFRSETAKYFIFIQMSKEMWEFDEDGDVFFEKCVHGFLPELFTKWKDLGANHVVSIVLFARIFYTEQAAADVFEDPVPLSRDPAGRPYRDFYRVVVDWEIRPDWTQVLIPLKKEFFRFRRDVLQQNDGEGSTILSGHISSSSEGNVLEAINLALNPFDKHYIDRDLLRTGLLIVVVTPGPGLFEVDKKLCRLTTQRMIDNGIGLDLVCLSKPPLYTVPLFQFTSKEMSPASVLPSATPSSSYSGPTTTTTGADQAQHPDGSMERRVHQALGKEKSYEKAGMADKAERKIDAWDPLYFDDAAPDSPERTYFTIPHWVDCSFWNRSSGRSQAANSMRFPLRCKMYEVQMMGVMEKVGSSIIVPYLDAHPPVSGDAATATSTAVDPDPAWVRGVGATAGVGDVLPRPVAPVLDYDRYDDAAFQYESAQTGKLRNISLASVTGGYESDASSKSRALSAMAADMTGRGGGMLTSLNVSISPDGSATSAARPYYRPGDTIRSLESDILRFNLSTDESETLTSEDRVALLRARARIEQISSPMHPAAMPIDGAESRLSQLGDSEELISASTSLAPIRIRSQHYRGSHRDRMMDGHVSALPLRNSYSGPESFKGGSSPLADYAARNMAKLSPGKSMILPPVPAPRNPIRQNFINPCNPSRNVVRLSSSIRRWQHVFPRAILPNNRSGAYLNWKSLCTPACLPLTTDFFPTMEELSEFYQEYIHTVSPADDVTPYQDEAANEQKRVEALLVELISQRLAQGFQFIQSPMLDATQKGGSGSSTDSVGPSGGGALSAFARQPSPEKQISVHLAPSTIPDPLPLPQATTGPYYLSLGDHVHKLSYSGKNLEIKRYVRRIAYNTDPLPYVCCIWPKNMDFYTPKTVSFSYPQLASYNWNYLDHLISGYQDEMTDALRFWRTRFLLVPMETIPQSNSLMNPSNENLDEEELRLAGFNKFIEQFEKARWVQPHEEEDLRRGKKWTKGERTVNIQFTTFNTSAYVRNELMVDEAERESGDRLSRRGSIASLGGSVGGGSSAGAAKDAAFASTGSGGADRLLRTSPLQQIATAMLAPDGVKFEDRRWHFRLYENVFVGSECVEWILRSFSDVETREDAIEFGNELLERGFFEHANRKHRFLDGYYYYRLKPEYTKEARGAKAGGASVWFARLKERASSESSLVDGSGTITAPTTAPSSPPTPSLLLHTQIPPNLRATLASSTLVSTRRVELSRREVIDLDPQRKSPRREMALLHYDTVHNPRNCYHFQLHWLVCTARLIEDLLQSWARVAEKCGLKLVEAPVEQ